MLSQPHFSTSNRNRRGDGRDERSTHIVVGFFGGQKMKIHFTLLFGLLFVSGCAIAPQREGNTFVLGSGNRQVAVKGINDELEEKIIITSIDYDYFSPLGIRVVSIDSNDPFFRGYIDKQSKEVELQLYVQFASLDWIWWDFANMKIGKDLKKIDAARIGSDVDCSGYACIHYEDVVLEIERDWLVEWSVSGKTIRFGSSRVNYTQDVFITSEEAKAFLSEIDRLSH